MHHLALLSRDVERTIAFYQDLLEFPLTELFENRDYQGSTHFFFDIGNGNLLAFFDFPGLDLGDYAEVLGGLHHLAISVEPARWQHLKEKLDAAGVPVRGDERGVALLPRPRRRAPRADLRPARRDVRRARRLTRTEHVSSRCPYDTGTTLLGVRRSSERVERGAEVGDEVVDGLDADRQADERGVDLERRAGRPTRASCAPGAR